MMLLFTKLNRDSSPVPEKSTVRIAHARRARCNSCLRLPLEVDEPESSGVLSLTAANLLARGRSHHTLMIALATTIYPNDE